MGASYKGQAIGAGNYSDITVFSFHPVKMITTGEGGMALTSSKTLRNKMLRSYRTHGVVRDPRLFTKFNKDEIWGFQQQDLGFNYRMSDIHAALGISQLKKLINLSIVGHKLLISIIKLKVLLFCLKRSQKM